MAEPHGKPAGEGLPDTTTGDRDISYGALYRFVFWLVVLTAVSMALMWGASAFLKRQAEKSDPAPSPLAEANERRLPPGPRLERSPAKDLKELREREDAVLTGWAWNGADHATARIPVERALEIVAEKGLPGSAR